MMSHIALSILLGVGAGIFAALWLSRFVAPLGTGSPL